MRRASTGSVGANGSALGRSSRRGSRLTGLGLGRGLFRLASNIGAGHGTDGAGEATAEEEAQASPETREQKMAHALKLVLDLVKGPVGVNDRTGLPDHVEKLLTDLVANGELAVGDMLKVMCNMTRITSDLHLEAQMSKGQAAIETLLFTYADVATDVLMIVQYYADGRATVATLMAAILAFSLVVQAVSGHAFGQGRWEAGARGGQRSLPAPSKPRCNPAEPPAAVAPHPHTHRAPYPNPHF